MRTLLLLLLVALPARTEDTVALTYARDDTIEDEDAGVRLAAVRALAHCGDAASHVLPRLRALCTSDDLALRQAARAACERLAPLSADAR